MYFADIHNHALFGTDDGPCKQEEMFAMLDEAYAQGVRALCFTPHWNPAVYGNNADKALTAFDAANRYLLKTGKDMALSLGNELRYSRDADKYLRNGSCRKYEKIRYVLVDFDFDESKDNMIAGLRNVLNVGIRPVFAHIERYPALAKDLNTVREMRTAGIRIQLDAASVLGKFGLLCRLRSLKLLSEGLADIVASDAHGIGKRPVLLKRAFEVIREKYTEDYAEKLFWSDPAELLNI